jgi:Major Facilitator Superfamily
MSRLSSVTLRTAFTVSTTGDWIYRFAVPTLILHLTGSAIDTAVAYMLEFLPYIVVGPFAGVFADRSSRRATMVGCDSASCVIALGIAGLAALHHPPIAALYACALTLACVRPLYFPAFQGLLVETVDEAARPKFNSWTQVTDGLLSLIGPALGTAIVAAAGVPLATVLDAVSFGASASLVATIAYQRRPRPAASQGGWMAGVMRDFASGFRAIAFSRAILAGTILITGANLAVYIIEGNLVYLVLHVEHHPIVALGAVFSSQGLGAILGAAAAPRLLRWRKLGAQPTGKVLLAAMGLSAVGMVVPAALPHWPDIVAGQGIQGCATALTVVCWFSAVQRIIPAEVIGRFVAVARAIAYATVPAGALIGAWLVGTSAPARALFGCAAVLQLVVFLATTRTALLRIDSAANDSAGDDGPAAVPRTEVA